jgi:hypothetical protein
MGILSCGASNRPCNLTLPSRGCPKGCAFRSPLMSNVRPHETVSKNCRTQMTSTQVFVVCLLAGSLCYMAPASAKPSIRAVYFDGDQANPIVIIHGDGFGTTPAAQSASPAPTSGLNYGTEFNFKNTATHPYVFSAGYNNLKEGRLDFVGLLADYSDTLIRFSFGSFYRANQYQLREGDAYSVTVKGAKFSGTVTYARAPLSARCPVDRALTCRPADTGGQGYGRATVRGVLYDSPVDVKYGLYKCRTSSGETCAFSGPGKPKTCDLYGVETAVRYIAVTGEWRSIPIGTSDFVVDPAHPENYPVEMFDSIKNQVLNCNAAGSCGVLSPKCD